MRAWCVRRRDSSWGDDVDATLQKAFEAQWQQAAGEPSKGGAEYDRARRTEGKVAWRELKAGKGFAAQVRVGGGVMS